MATIYAWTGALNKRGELDNLPELCDFAKKLEEACIDTLNSGVMTKDLVNLAEGIETKAVNSKDFILEIRKNLELKLA
jgi:isocitrate dehydrogenase